jgi:hypothetical protein
VIFSCENINPSYCGHGDKIGLFFGFPRLHSGQAVSLGKQRNEHINKIDLAQADLQSAVKKVRVWHKAKP